MYNIGSISRNSKSFDLNVSYIILAKTGKGSNKTEEVSFFKGMIFNSLIVVTRFIIGSYILNLELQKKRK